MQVFVNKDILEKPKPKKRKKKWDFYDNVLIPFTKKYPQFKWLVEDCVFGWAWWVALSHPWLIAKGIKDEVTYAYQRVVRGYDKRATYDLHYHLSTQIPALLRELKQWSNSYPAGLLDPDESDTDFLENEVIEEPDKPADMETDKIADIKTDKTADKEADKTSDTKAGKIANTETDKIANMDTDKIADTETEPPITKPKEDGLVVWHQILDEMILGFESAQNLVNHNSPIWEEFEAEWEKRHPGVKPDYMDWDNATKHGVEWKFLPEYDKLREEMRVRERDLQWHDDQMALFDRGMKLFHKYFMNLWD